MSIIGTSQHTNLYAYYKIVNDSSIKGRFIRVEMGSMGQDWTDLLEEEGRAYPFIIFDRDTNMVDPTYQGAQTSQLRRLYGQAAKTVEVQWMAAEVLHEAQTRHNYRLMSLACLAACEPHVATEKLLFLAGEFSKSQTSCADHGVLCSEQQHDAQFEALNSLCLSLAASKKGPTCCDKLTSLILEQAIELADIRSVVALAPSNETVAPAEVKPSEKTVEKTRFASDLGVSI